MQLSRHLGLVLIVSCLHSVLGDCDYDAAVTPCFARHKVEQSESKINKVDLNNIIRAFQAGIPLICQNLQSFITCVKDTTKHCSGSETSKLKSHYEKIEFAVNVVCFDKKQELTASTGCVLSSPVRQGFSSCQSQLETMQPSCKMINSVTRCLGDLMTSHCPDVTQTMTDIARMFLSNSLNINNCQPDKTEHQSNGSDRMSLSVKSTYAFIVFLFLLLV